MTLDCSFLMGSPWNVSEKELDSSDAARRAAESMAHIRREGRGPAGDHVLFTHLPELLTENTLMPKEECEQLKKLCDRKEHPVDALISVGIGGSYLGNQMLFDLFCGPYWNLSDARRKGLPKVFFAGHNEDPASLSRLIGYVKEEAAARQGDYHVLVLVISKSGGTVEPMTALYALEKELPGFCQVETVAITDAHHGALLEKAKEHGWMHFTVPDGIGGRFSVLSQVGMVFGALCGMDIASVLQGAHDMDQACQSDDWRTNPAMALALMKYMVTRKLHITSEIVMPYGDSLRSLGWWYAQLMAESLGKRLDLHGNVVHYGRTLAPCVGTTDMHSMTQEHQEGGRNKLIQFISVEKPAADIQVCLTEQGETGEVSMGRVLHAALDSNARALASEERLSCHISIPEVSPYHVGGLLYFFMLAVAYEGAMAEINAFDQPGVEAYKKILHASIRNFIKE